MKVLFVTDVHGSVRALSWVKKKAADYDSIIVGGDLAKGGTKDFAAGFLRGAASGGAKVIFVHGNWDPADMTIPDGTIPLHSRTQMLGKFSVGGLGGSGPTPFKGPFEMGDDEARDVLARIGHVDILVSHSPPLMTKCDRAHSGHIGSLPVREYVQREGPSLVLSGHVHEGRAVDRLGASTVVNPGPLMEGKYAELLLDGIVSVELKSDPGIGGE
ncbi:MAG TPA: metallophosphoesterase [Nitrososphaerales archaeon]|nr:metallophosphoesterase [Nitrososphaerales archaeon]